MTMTRLMRAFATAGAILIAGGLPILTAGAQPVVKAGADGAKPKTAPKADTAAKDRLIFRSGKTVEGKILSETDSEIRMKVIGAGGLTVETTYSKADILSVERATPDPAAADKGKDGKDNKAGGAAAAVKPDPTPKPGAAASKEGAAKIYMLDIKGEFGRDISATPLRQIMKDIKEIQPDVLVIKMDTEYKYHGEERKEFDTRGAREAFSQLETVRELQTMLTDDVRDDPEWKVKPRLVCWVKRALGGSAFLPFVCPEIYFASDGLHGGMGYLEFIFNGVGDETPREKQYSLRLARAEGLAIKGGHEPKLIRAMARADYVLSVRYEGGKPIFIERMPEGPDEELLTDDGDESSGRRDTLADVVRFRGNDVLTLNAELAYKLGLSNGTADTMEDLAYKLGISRSYTVVKGKAERILDEWGKAVTAAEHEFRRKLAEQGQVQVEPPGGYEQRTAARGKRIRLLTELKALLERYGEALNPEELGISPEEAINELNIRIEALRTQQRLDRK